MPVIVCKWDNAPRCDGTPSSYETRQITDNMEDVGESEDAHMRRPRINSSTCSRVVYARDIIIPTPLQYHKLAAWITTQNRRSAIGCPSHDESEGLRTSNLKAGEPWLMGARGQFDDPTGLNTHITATARNNWCISPVTNGSYYSAYELTKNMQPA
jgi:hypothetical protein